MPHALVPLILVLVAFPATTAQAAGGGTLTVGGSRAAVSLDARSAPFGEVRDALAAYGVHLQGDVDDGAPVSLSFAPRPPQEVVAAIGEALGGLHALRVSWPDGRLPGLTETEHFLVRGERPLRRLLEAYCLPPPVRARVHLQPRLLEAGGALAPEILDYLSTASDARSRALAIGLLGRVEDPRSVPELLRLLREDPAPLGREAAAVALGSPARPGAGAALRAALADSDPGVALAAAWALLALGDEAGVPLALLRLQDGNAAVALRAVEVIEGTGDGRHLPALERAGAAGGALLRGRARAAATVIRTAGLPTRERAAALGALLGDPSPEVRHYGRAALAKIADEDALAVLEPIAADPASPGRAEAARVAGALRNRGLAPPPAAVIE